ncbi:MAG TPA: antibiotic biosynthesis monooxygenase family protein [Pyrinomonadaceae bacterium]
MIASTTTITVAPEKGIELAQTIHRLLDPIKKMKGCLGFHFYLDTVDENSSLLFSEWEAESDLNNYLRSNNFKILSGALKVLSVRSVDYRASSASSFVPRDYAAEQYVKEERRLS